jgi:hypothetical protein
VTAPRRLVIPGLLALPAILVIAVVALTRTSELFPNQGDLNLYLEKATAVAAGQFPYRDFPFEYPPAALVPMVVPYLAWPFSAVDLDRYKWLFGGWEALLAFGLALVLDRIVRLAGDADAADATRGPSMAARRFRTGLRLVLVCAGAVLAIAFRFDLFPALLMAVAVWAALSGRPGAAGVALGLGVLGKLFPIAILPAIAVPWLVPFDVRGLVRLGQGLVGTLLAGLLPFVAVAGSQATFQFLRYNTDRGLQVESIGGGLAVFVGLLRGQPVQMDFGFSSVNVDGDFASAWLGVLPILTIVGFGLVAWLGWRRIRAEAALPTGIRPSTVVALATVSLLMLLATSKVYSIQYVVWLVPFAALLGGLRFWLGGQFWLAAALVALTIPIHPLLYADLVKQAALPILVLNVRNALLITLLAWLLWDLRAARSDIDERLRKRHVPPRERTGQPKAEPRTAASGLGRP